jgi:hypothetical protein
VFRRGIKVYKQDETPIKEIAMTFHSVSIDQRNKDLGRPPFVSRETFATRQQAIDWAIAYFTVELVEVSGMTHEEIKAK